MSAFWGGGANIVSRPQQLFLAQGPIQNKYVWEPDFLQHWGIRKNLLLHLPYAH